MKLLDHYTSISESLKILEHNVVITPRSETVPLSEVFGRVLAVDVVAKSHIPPFDASHMDGFAVSSKDLKDANDSSPVRLRIRVGDKLGRKPRQVLKSGEAYTVPTGGFLPRRSDAVVPVERAKIDGKEIVLNRQIPPGSHVYPAGSDVKNGELILSKGIQVRAQEVGLLGSLHIGKVKVYRRPMVAIVPTGSELTGRVGKPPPGKVTETHSFVISRLIERAGGVPKVFGIAKDERADVEKKLRSALQTCDIILTMAGTSKGGSDITAVCIDSIGKPGMLVHGVKVHRGRVMGVGAIRGKPIIVLPGPIQGALNAFVIFAYRLIMAHLGRGFAEPPKVHVTLDADWEAKRGFEGFAKVIYLRTKYSQNGFGAIPVVGETEKMTLLTSSNTYAIVPEGVQSLHKGELVEAHLLPGFSFGDAGFLG